MDTERSSIERALAAAGCIAPEQEAAELIRAAASGIGPIEELLARRATGEPLAWITGEVGFCGIRIRVDRGIYVPRPLTQPLALRAATLLPSRGIAVDLCTGSGAVAAVMRSAHPQATIVATDLDPAAVACARRNGVHALQGDLDAPLPSSLEGSVDVLTAIVPYVPTNELHLLPRDVREHEPRLALDGGAGGTGLLERVVAVSPRWLRRGGSLLLEIGGDQARALDAALAAAGLSAMEVLRDVDGDDRAIGARSA